LGLEGLSQTGKNKPQLRFELRLYSNGSNSNFGKLASFFKGSSGLYGLNDEAGLIGAAIIIALITLFFKASFLAFSQA